MTGAIEEHVASYDKHAHGRITAIDTRLSNRSIISKKENKNYLYDNSLFFFYTAISPHEDNICMSIAS